jgi:hypothetical protein
LRNNVEARTDTAVPRFPRFPSRSRAPAWERDLYAATPSSEGSDSISRVFEVLPEVSGRQRLTLPDVKLFAQQFSKNTHFQSTIALLESPKVERGSGLRYFPITSGDALFFCVVEKARFSGVFAVFSNTSLRLAPRFPRDFNRSEKPDLVAPPDFSEKTLFFAPNTSRFAFFRLQKPKLFGEHWDEFSVYRWEARYLASADRSMSAKRHELVRNIGGTSLTLVPPYNSAKGDNAVPKTKRACGVMKQFIYRQALLDT